MIKMKKSDMAIAYSVVALILGGVLVGLAGCQMDLPDSLDIATPSSGVDTGSTWIGGDGGTGPRVVPYFGIEAGGYTGPALITYYNPDATLDVTITAAGTLEYASGTAPTGAVKSIEVMGNKYLIGRTAPTVGSPIVLNLGADGGLRFRPAVDSSIPIGAYAEFQKINDDPSAMGTTYKQEADLDLMNEEWTPVGRTSSLGFGGNYDGGGKKLTRLRINDPSSTTPMGLFGYVSGTVKNLGIDSGEVKGGDYVGGVAGVNKGTITACYNNTKVEGNDYVGGIAGNNTGEITACYNTGEVKGNSNVGGVAGVTNDEITACYNTGLVSGKAYAGGIAGYNTSDTVNSCYWESGVALSRDGNDVSEITGKFLGGHFPNLSGDTDWATSADGSSGFWKPATTGGGATLPQLWWEK